VVKLENMETNQLDWSQEFSGMSGESDDAGGSDLRSLVTR